MIVDENLNDCTSSYIKQLKKDITFLERFATIMLFALTVVLIVLFVTSEKKRFLERDNKILTEQLYKDETELALEHSIGYWFINKPEEITDSLLYVFLSNNNAWYPDILLKQAKLESGNYTSNVYKNSNNLYGMKKVGKRLSTQLKDTYNGYGCYTNWCESVLDRILWDIYYFKGIKPTREEYLNAMSFYAEAENYIKLLNL